MATALVPSSSFQSALTMGHPDAMDMAPSSDQLITSTLSDSAHAFLRSAPTLHTAALVLAKRYLDPLATSVSEVQDARLRAARRKRKRGDTDGPTSESVLRLKELHLEGFVLEQVWEQARRILDASCKEVELSLTSERGKKENSPAAAAIGNETRDSRKAVRFENAGSTSSSDAEIDGSDKLNGVEPDGEDPEGPEPNDLDLDGNGLATEDLDEDELEALESMDEDDEGEDAEVLSTFVKDKNGLNDGFFSIDDFNKDTEFLEQQDARGDPIDGAASDEEDVDWDADPRSQPTSIVASASKQNQSQPESSDEEDGPTFGNADLNAPWSSDSEDVGDEDVSMEGDAGADASRIYYADFFAPPPRSLTKSARRRALPKTQPPPEARPASPTEEDLQRTISVVHRDIFSDDSLSNSSDLDEGDPSSTDRNLSTHERRQQALASQIRALEAEAIAKRQWALSGEARAADRPLNSLLEEDLDFERAGKPVPVITAEVSSSIEDLIKSRILARQFDEVIRRRPGVGDDALAGASGRRGLVDVSDRKADQSLAEIYETEHLRKTDPNFVDKRDASLKAAHEEIERLWNDVSAKLDALSSWHYRPKPPDVTVSVVSDAPRVLMEDARPAGVSGMGAEESGLAPQEVFKVGDDVGKRKGEGDEGVVVTTGGGVVGKAELTREQKLRRRRREKERTRKEEGSSKAGARLRNAGQQKPRVGKNAKKVEEQNKLLSELTKGGVKVIGKGGELTDVQGRKAEVGGSAGAVRGAGRFKL